MKKIRIFIRRVLNRAFRIKYETYYLFARDINELLPLPVIDDKYKVFELNESNFKEWDFSLFDKREKWLKRVQSGKYSSWIVVDGKLVCYVTWLSLNEFIFPKYVTEHVLLKPDEAILFDSLCSKQYRGQGLHSYMDIFRLNQAFINGKRRVSVLVLSGNIPAIKVQEKSGLRIVKRVRFFYCTWLGIRKMKFTDYEG